MKSLLKFASFCLFFLSLSLVGFGQVDTLTRSAGTYGYLDSTFFKEITIIESKRTENGWINKIRNIKTGLESELIQENPDLKGGIAEYRGRNLRYPKNAVINNISGTVL